MLGARGVRGDERQVDVGGQVAGKLDLRALGGFLQTLMRLTVGQQVDAVFLLEFARDVVDDAVIEVVAAQTVVAGGRQNLEYAVANLHQRNVERTAAQIVHQNLVNLALVKAVGQSSGGRLVDNALYVQTGNAAGVLGRLTLRVREVRGHGDDRLGHGLTQIGLGIRLQLLKNHGADLRGRVILAVDVHLIIGTHFTLDGNHRALRVGNSLTLGDLTDETLAVLGKGHDGRRGAGAFRVCDNRGFAAFHNGDAGIGRTKVNTDNLRHNIHPPDC